MPQREDFWNPYRWVSVSDEQITREPPTYRHRWHGLAGKLHCTLEALTPLFIGGSDGDNRFIHSGKTKKPFIPGTSLKGMIRALVELVGNAAIPFPQGNADPQHTLEKASEGQEATWRLDIAARMFGYLKQGEVFAGLVRFTDAEPMGSAKELGTSFKVVVGQPRPEKHKPFYPDTACRKFYHHHVGTTKLVPPPAGITQTRDVYPLPPGTKFGFHVNFENLREKELNLLLYCLVLEEQVQVTLNPEALKPGTKDPVTLQGPLRHKLGGCKPHGAGSIKISIEKMELWDNMADRYRGQRTVPRVVEGEELQAELRTRTHSIVARTDPTMQDLRAMLIYCQDDPRKPVHYPSYQWFQKDKGTPLKPTR